jgi:hypothetical protein
VKYLFLSILIHVLVLSFVWVGFSVPIPRNQNSFTYLGELVASQGNIGSNAAGQNDSDSDAIIFGDRSPAYFTPWLKMRQVEKPR